MNKLIFTDRNGRNFKKIDKKQARKEYESNKDIVLIGNNLRPFNDFYPFWITVNRTTMLENSGENMDFSKVVSSYEHYNCVNNQTGYKCSYYVAVD